MNDQRRYGMLMPGASRLKRKERESVYPAKRSPLAPPPPQPQPQKLTQTPATVATSTAFTNSKGSKGMEAATSSNKLLAGYMAYEFLTKGTLLGQKFDGARADTAARGKSRAETEAVNGNETTYKEITSLLMMKNDGGARIPGIVNPTQLGRWIQM